MVNDSNTNHRFENSGRRRFLKNLGVAGAALSATELLPSPAVGQENSPPANTGPVPRRDFDIATSILKQEGFGCVCNVPGSWQAWKNAGLPVDGVVEKKEESK